MQTKRKKKSSICRPDDCCGGNATSLVDLIRCYKANHTSLKEMLRDFRNLSLTDAIRFGAGAIQPKDDHVPKRMYSHQYRLGRGRCKEAAGKLLMESGRIANCRTFEQLKRLITAATSEVDGFGELARYDASLRIGAKRKLLPKVVYLHAGAKKGAENWGLDTSNDYLKMSQLQQLKRFKMQPYEVEDFLCIYKDELKQLRKRLGASRSQPTTQRSHKRSDNSAL